MGSGAKNDYRKLLSGVAKFQGEVERTGRRLGSQLHRELANEHREEGKGCSYAEKLALDDEDLENKDTTIEAKRTVFCSRVREAGISELEAYVLNKSGSAVQNQDAKVISASFDSKASCSS